MKKNWLISLLALGCAATLSFAFAGCGAQGEKGDQGLQGEQGPQGEKGDQGVGIEKVEYDKDGNLVITLTDGSKQTVAMPEKEEGGADTTQEGTPGLHYQRIAGKDEYRVVGLGVAEESDIVIPCTYKGLPVTEIADYAFEREKCITSITLPDSVTSIGEGAFAECEALVGVTIGNSVTHIEEEAFVKCDCLMEVIIPKNVTRIGDNAFGGGDVLIIYCEVESQPNGWDSDWNSYEGPASPVVWDCKNNDVADDGYIYTMIDGIRYGIKDGVATVVRQASNIQAAIILSSITYKNNSYSVTSIGVSAFRYCRSLTEVVIGNSVTSIGSFAFYNCSSLTEIIILDSVTSIGDDVFYGCSSLTIYCEAESKPSGWDSWWNHHSNCPVVWGYKGQA